MRKIRKSPIQILSIALSAASLDIGRIPTFANRRLEAVKVTAKIEE